MQRCLSDAERLKSEGNEHFRLKEWEEALSKYKSALGHLPKRKEKQPTPEASKGKGRNADPDDEQDPVPVEPAVNRVRFESAGEPFSATEDKCAKARAILNANIGACYVKIVRLLVRLCCVGVSVVLLNRTTISRLWRHAVKVCRIAQT